MIYCVLTKSCFSYSWKINILIEITVILSFIKDVLDFI